MQLAITVLGNRNTPFFEQILSAINRCQCNITEIRSSDFTSSAAMLFLVEGNWNQVAKLDNILDALEKQLKIQISRARQEKTAPLKTGLPYTLEAMCQDQKDIVLNITTFLTERHIAIEEITGSRYSAPYIDTPIFSIKFIIVLPSNQRLLQLREDFLDFCDQLNLDAILEPIKR